MFLIEWVLGLLAGWVGWRIGWVSIFSLLMVLPFLPWDFHSSFVVGLAGVLIVSSSSSPSPFHSQDIFLGLLLGVVGVAIYSMFPLSLSLIEGWIPWLGVGLLMVLLGSTRGPFRWVAGGLLLALGVGYLVLVRWTIPVGVPSLLVGLMGFRSFAGSTSTSSSLFSSLRDGVVGVFAGLLPGIGPGLLGLTGARFSPSLSVANLVFSMGLVSLSGNIRSAPAAALAFVSWSRWEFILFGLVLSVLFSSVLTDIFPRKDDSFSWVSSAFLLLILLFVGGWPSIGCALMGYAVSRLLEAGGVPSEVGLVFLLPSIMLFYL